MIDIHFTLSEAEYVEAQKLYLSTNKSRKRLRYILFAVLLIGLLGLLAGAMTGKSAETLRQLAPAFLLLCLFLCFPLLQTWGLKRRFLKEKHNFTNAHLILDATGYRMDVPGIGGGIAEWSGMDGWLEGKSVFLIRSGLLMRLIPKAPLDETEIEEARNLLRDKLGPVGIMRKR